MIVLNDKNMTPVEFTGRWYIKEGGWTEEKDQYTSYSWQITTIYAKDPSNLLMLEVRYKQVQRVIKVKARTISGWFGMKEDIPAIYGNEEVEVVKWVSELDLIEIISCHD